MAYTISPLCVSCRNFISPDKDTEVMVLTKASTEFKEKTGKLEAKIKSGVKDCLCASCAEEMQKLIAEQKDKGAK